VATDPTTERSLAAFMAARRTATLATISGDGRPRLVPICFVVASTPGERGIVLWSPLDAKPKRDADVHRLARVRDIEMRPDVALLFDRWSEDWTELAWVRVHGKAAIVDAAAEPESHARAAAALRAKYPQYRSQPIEQRPMIRIVVSGVTSWSATTDASRG
jgi:PPOX class probable F420-dependent enzyme